MANLHNIKRRINSVESTKQITRTMEMVAAAKIRRATNRMLDAQPWANAISDMLVSVSPHAPKDADDLLIPHDEVKKVLIVVVVSDRGLAGGFNSNTLRATTKLMNEKKREGAEAEIIACGKKAGGYFTYRNIEPVMQFKDLSADPTTEEAAQITHYLTEGYRNGDFDEVYVIFNHAKNNAEQRLIEQQVLPITNQEFSELIGLKVDKEEPSEEEGEKLYGDVDFEPEPQEVMHDLLEAYVRNAVYFALIDSAAAEQGARRTAMQSATDNAEEMSENLTRLYNRARQGAITTEITEIVGGAAVMED
ncbi:MAG: ATP synthase F1 subunit gamma [Eggerthellaceae bacterium]|jgi:F-type H+-transporting ATPase subunit gamma